MFNETSPPISWVKYEMRMFDEMYTAVHNRNTYQHIRVMCDDPKMDFEVGIGKEDIRVIATILRARSIKRVALLEVMPKAAYDWDEYDKAIDAINNALEDTGE